MYDKGLKLPETDYEFCIGQVIRAIGEGKIVAVKGVGGYLLLGDACHEGALRSLRARKGRARKPFALMYPDLETAAADVHLDAVRQEALLGEASPIVLAFICPDRRSPALPGTDSARAGSTGGDDPLRSAVRTDTFRSRQAGSGHECQPEFLAVQLFSATTGGVLEELSGLADLLLMHNREITMPQDDSVLRFSKNYHQPILLRRSRGMAPAFVHPPFDGLPETVLAMGADMKSAFGFLHRGFAYISQYFSDLDNFDTQERFRKCRDHFGLFEATPSVVLADKHPQYFSTQLGGEYAREKEIPVVAVTTYVAHFAAVLGENHLLDSAGPILGVIWDGTGMGTDGQIWGGEFFKYDGGVFTRCGQ